MPLPTELIANAPATFDLTEPADQAHLYELSEAVLALPDVTVAELEEAARRPGAPLAFRMAAKLVASRRYLLSVDRPVHLGIVFAMWGEQNRLRPKSADNPTGEDALRMKLAQLDWATRDTPVTWTLYAVDDGCPHQSGDLAREIAAGEAHGDRVQVLHLDHALPTADWPLKPLASASDSRKGGAIIYGAHTAIGDGVDAVIYTDADNSVHLGQIGLLLAPYLESGINIVLGNRKHPDAVLVKEGARWGIGIKVLRHMQRMIGQAIFSRGIKDTQAAFKLYDSRLLSKIIERPTVYDFSFDTDWILAAISMEEPFVTVPFAFIDSAAESASITQGPMTTWETLLKGLLKSVRRWNVPHSEAMARVLDEEVASYRDLDLLIDHLPEELADAGEAEYGDPAIMSPEALQAWIQARKAEANQAPSQPE